jgi:hypothetical protein
MQIAVSLLGVLGYTYVIRPARSKGKHDSNNGRGHFLKSRFQTLLTFPPMSNVCPYMPLPIRGPKPLSTSNIITTLFPAVPIYNADQYTRFQILIPYIVSQCSANILSTSRMWLYISSQFL